MSIAQLPDPIVQDFAGIQRNFDALNSRPPAPWVNVTDRAYGAKGGGVDDTAAFGRAMLAAGPSGTIYAPQGTYGLADLREPDVAGRWHGRIVGDGPGATILKRIGGTRALDFQGSASQDMWNVGLEQLAIDGNGGEGARYLSNASGSVQQCYFINVRWQNCTTAFHVDGTASGYQADTFTYLFCQWWDNTTGLWVDSNNAQQHVCVNPKFNTNTTAVRLSHGGVLWWGGECQQVGDSTNFLLDGLNIESLHLVGVITETSSGTMKDIDSPDPGYWPQRGVILEGCSMQGSGGIRQTLAGGGGSSVLTARHTKFDGCLINAVGADSLFRDENCTYLNGAAWNPTGAACVRHRWNLNGYWHYQGGNLVSRSPNYHGEQVQDDSAYGLVLKSPNGHYWRETISNAGAVTWTDLGTTRPD